MDLINWSPNEIDTVFSMRSLGSGEPTCPARTSVEDIEDISLFGTMITRLLLIGLGIALVYRGNQTMVTAVQSPTKLSNMIEAVGKAVGTQTVAIQNLNHNMVCHLGDAFGFARNEYFGDQIELNRMDEMDRYGQAVWTCKGCICLKDQTISILSTFGSLNSTGLDQGRCWGNIPPEVHCWETLSHSSHSFPNFLRSTFFTPSVTSRCVTSALMAAGADGCLLALGYLYLLPSFPPIKSCVFML